MKGHSRNLFLLCLFLGAEQKPRLFNRRLIFKYEPLRSPWLLRDTVLKVKEGGNVALSSETIGIQHGGVNQSCSFNLMAYPEHGILQTRDRRNISEFSSRELNDKLVFYTHDSSESEIDALDLLIACPGRQPKLVIPLRECDLQFFSSSWSSLPATGKKIIFMFLRHFKHQDEHSDHECWYIWWKKTVYEHAKLLGLSVS